MNHGALLADICFLSGQTIKPYSDPEKIKAPGFYFHLQSGFIEHWSRPCDYNRYLKHSYRNHLDLLCDGYISLLDHSDVDELAARLQNWARHLKKYGVE